jgi:hypothetical protein
MHTASPIVSLLLVLLGLLACLPADAQLAPGVITFVHEDRGRR